MMIKNMKTIYNLTFSLEQQKPYTSFGVKRAFHSKVALTIENLTPKIFKKKINLDKAKTIPLNSLNSLGHIKYFPATIKEWSSSIYAHYKNNHIKSLPLLDKNVVKLIKSYFNFYHLSENLKYGRILHRFRRVSLKKIFVSKAELKHTNSKVIINIDVYNLQKRLLWVEYLWMRKHIDLLTKEATTMNKYVIFMISRTNDELKLKILRRTSDKLKLEISSYKETIRYYDNFLKFYVIKKFGSYISKLKEVIRKIYTKKVEFNIVILKHMYLNSDILSQAISLKLRDRNNRVWTVLRSCISMVQVPNANKFKEKSKANRAESLVDKIKNLDLDAIISYANGKGPYPDLGPALEEAYFYSDEMLEAKHSNDSLNQLLFGFLPILPEGKYEGWYVYCKNWLKYKAIGGVRLEAKGRLTRRFTASRSVFKLIWKGGLKNIDSSYKGLSAVILRGHVKSNVQYSFIKSKNRIGSFGVKGWVSGK